MWDILNPWGALRDARATIKGQGSYIDGLHQRLAAEQDAHQKALEEAARIASRSMSKAIEINQLRKLIAKGHFRNPATGRLGKRGETFE